jgi:uncharacterized protein with HEPN domain
MNFIIKKTDRIALAELIGDETLQKALLRSLEVIGEAAKNVSDDFRVQHKTVPWKEMAGLRDKLIHFYFGVDWNTVWDVIKNKIPQLKPQIELILKK